MRVSNSCPSSYRLFSPIWMRVICAELWEKNRVSFICPGNVCLFCPSRVEGKQRAGSWGQRSKLNDSGTHFALFQSLCWHRPRQADSVLPLQPIAWYVCLQESESRRRLLHAKLCALIYAKNVNVDFFQTFNETIQAPPTLCSFAANVVTLDVTKTSSSLMIVYCLFIVYC